MSTNWKKRGQALLDGKPNLTLNPKGTRKVNHIGNPVTKVARGTEYAPRNPMHDTEPHEQEESRSDPIRTQLIQRGVR